MAFEEYDRLPDGAWIVDPSEFREAFLLMARVYTGEDDFNPAGYKMKVRSEWGDTQHVQVEDTPLNRILLALKEWYHEEPVEKFISVCWRIFSLSKLIREGTLDDWVVFQPEDGYSYISGRVISVAATFPLHDVEGFDPEAFREAVTSPEM